MPETMPGIEAAQSLAAEWSRTLTRAVRALELATAPEPSIGLTPKQVVYRRNKARLYRYESSRTRPVPVLFIPNLGISRPSIFDLQPGSSFVEHMCRQGYDFYLLDWGVYGEEDNGLTVDECVTRILPRVVRKVLETSGADGLAVIGYCMGAPLSVSFVAQHPDVPVRAYVNMAGPIDFAQAGLFAQWLDKRFYDVDRVVDTVGAIPADWVKVGFKLLRPTMDVTTALNLWWNLDNPRYVDGYRALSRWANDYVPVPGGVLPAVGEGLLPGQPSRPGDAPARRGGGPSRAGSLPAPGGRREGGLHRPARMRARADRPRRQHGQDLLRAARGPHLPDRGALRVGPLLAARLGLAGGAARVATLAGRRNASRS